jgi:hypothetical protein
MARQLSAISAARGIDRATVAREALTAYLAEASADSPTPQLFGRPARAPHDLEVCITTVLRHWPSEIEQRLHVEMERRGLSLRNQALGILFGWATRRWTS